MVEEITASYHLLFTAFNYFRQALGFAASRVARLLAFMLCDVHERVISDFNFSESRQARVSGPDAVASSNSHGQYGHARFQRKPHSARLKLQELAVSVFAPAFREDYDCAAATQPL